MEKFVVFGRYCEDAIIKREPFREQHLKRLKNLKDSNILVTLGPTKCTKYLFGIFNANNENELKDFIEEDIYWKKGIWINYDVCLLYTSPSPRDRTRSRMPSSA